MWQIKLAALILVEVLAVVLTVKPSKKWATELQNLYVRQSEKLYGENKLFDFKGRWKWWLFRWGVIFSAVVIAGFAFSLLFGPVQTP